MTMYKIKKGGYTFLKRDFKPFKELYDWINIVALELNIRTKIIVSFGILDDELK
jgi:hypothetical protein